MAICRQPAPHVNLFSQLHYKSPFLKLDRRTKLRLGRWKTSRPMPALKFHNAPRNTCTRMADAGNFHRQTPLLVFYMANKHNSETRQRSSVSTAVKIISCWFFQNQGASNGWLIQRLNGRYDLLDHFFAPLLMSWWLQPRNPSVAVPYLARPRSSFAKLNSIVMFSPERVLDVCATEPWHTMTTSWLMRCVCVVL